jgi:hypothetical protein
VDKYGEEFLGLLNSGKLTKKQIKSLLWPTKQYWLNGLKTY